MICAVCPNCHSSIFRIKLTIWNNKRNAEIRCIQCGNKIKLKDVKDQISENTLPPYVTDEEYQEAMRVKRQHFGLRRIK